MKHAGTDAECAAPPYAITPKIVERVEGIGEALARAEAAGTWRDPRLRRANRSRAIRGSLAIEGNALGEEEITALLDGRRVAGSPRDVREARNAITAYQRLRNWNPAEERDLLEAHAVLMDGLLPRPGRYRGGHVAVMGGGEVDHIGPPPRRLPRLMRNLLRWLGAADEHPLIASSVFHYEFEFIHPFEDGNGRLGRLWQTLILTRWKVIFADVSVESMVHARQRDYYDAIRRSSEAGESTPFIEFMLDAIREALLTMAPDEGRHSASDRVSDG